MDNGIEWLDHRTQDGVTERRFRIADVDHVIPGVLWLPAAAASPLPLILLGHGGSSNKYSQRNVALANWFANHAGLAAVAIDGPYHGDRTGPEKGVDWHAQMAKEGVHGILDQMTSDWRTTMNAGARCKTSPTDAGACGDRAPHHRLEARTC